MNININDLKTLPEQVLDNTKKLNEEILPAVEASTAISAEALEVALGIEEKVDDAVITANEAKEIAEGIEAKADSAIEKSESADALALSATAKANEAYELSVETSKAIDKAIEDSSNAVTVANEAKALSEINKEAIEALGEFDAEAIATLTGDVETLKGKQSEQELEIETLISQVDSAEGDITNMKLDIQNNATGVNVATSMAAEASTYAADAYSRANTGVTNAAIAQAKADEASDAAYNAESAANAAQSTADSAKESADEALSKTACYIYDTKITSYTDLSSAIGQGILNGKNLGYNKFEIILEVQALASTSYKGQMTGVLYDDGTGENKLQYYTVSGVAGSYEVLYSGIYNFSTTASYSAVGRTLQYSTNTFSTTLFSTFCAYGVSVRIIATKYD